MAPKPAPGEPIQALDFKSLTDSIHLYKPSSSAPAESTDPGLVIICSWAFAQDKHIVKYLKGYQQLYQHAQLLLIQNSIYNMMVRPDSWQTSLFEPAIYAIKDYISSVGSQESRILLHLFSNGGAHTTVQLSQFYAESSISALRSPQLPVDALILDSSPSLPNPVLGVKALTQGLPRIPGLSIISPILLHATLASTYTLHKLGISEFAMSKLWRMLKDPYGAFAKATIPRTYIFSDTDEMIEEKDIKLHAQETSQAMKDAGMKNAGKRITCEEFKGTKHVNHMASNPERYWGIVKTTWESALKEKDSLAQ